MRYWAVILLFIVSLLPFPHRYRVSVSNLNYGGCGYYAYYLSGKLPGSVIVSVKGGRHYMVWNGWGYMDNRGTFIPHAIWLWSLGDIEPISREELRVMLDDHSLWNSKFNLKDTAVIVGAIKYVP